MPKYTLTYEPDPQLVKEIEVEGADIRTALNAAEKIPGYSLECIDEVVPDDSDKEAEYLGVYAFCESCGLPICHDDDYRTDVDGGIHICAACFEKEQAAE